MHFSIPDTAELSENGGSSYTVFNVHINGVYHCSVRYSQFHTFHEQLKKEYSPSILPPFPPKKIKLFPLTPTELDERRSMIERYIQLLSQNPQIAQSDTFNQFLLNAQKESQKAAPENVVFHVYLMNGHQITVDIMSTDQTDAVLETVASKIEIPSDYVYYFGLFLIKKEDGKDNAIVRQLQDFESPYISLRATTAEITGGMASSGSGSSSALHRIVLRKSYWETPRDDELLEDRITMNLLYVQAVNDVERGWVAANKDQRKQLNTLQQRNSKKEYLRYVRTLKYYGYIQFKPCMVDYPAPDCRAIIAAGNRELNFRIQVSREDVKEVSFKVTRMRCWRITTMIPENMEGLAAASKLELAFEYLVAKDTLRWVTICSDQAILMSMCLQAMVDELILKKQGGKIRRPQDKQQRRNATQNGNSVKRQSSHDAQPVSENGTNQTVPPNQPAQQIPPLRPHKLPERVAIKHSVHNSYTGVTSENDAFEGIGDDDL